MRIIPKNTKVKIEFFKNVSLSDIIVGLVGMVSLMLVIMSNFSSKWVIAFLIALLFGLMYVSFDGVKTYILIVDAFKFLAYKKEYNANAEEADNDIKKIIPFKNVKDGFIEYGEYYAGVIEIFPREFRLLSEYKQNQLIDQCYANVLRAVSGTATASLVKLDRPMLMDKYVLDEDRKRGELKKIYDLNDMNKVEFLERDAVIGNREDILLSLNSEHRTMQARFYLVVYDTERSAINEVLNYAEDSFDSYSMRAHRLEDFELAIFLKYNYTVNFDERDIYHYHPDELMDYVIPKDIKFGLQKVAIDEEDSYTFTVYDYPLSVGNAWGYSIFNIPNTKVVMNMKPVAKNKSVKRVDRAVDEIISQSTNTTKASKVINQETHIQSLVDLLARISNDNESLFEVNLHITVYNRKDDTESEKLKAKQNVKKKIRRILSENGFKVTDNFGRQMQAFICSGISRLDTMTSTTRGIHSSSVAAVFPFVLNAILDDKGVLLGESYGMPVILDMFHRDKERVNSNMVILGKSGSGKSFATKTILSNLAAENSKIFILDPENEYDILAKNIGGRLIDVGTAKQGRINPFHIITSLDSDEDDDGGMNSSFSVHLQFLEEFYKQILQGITPDALEHLNNLTIEMYKEKGITKNTALRKFTAEQFPIFEDLHKLIERDLKKVKDEYTSKNLRILINFISKFAGEGRNANLWNGHSSLTVKENFTVFNFQSLLANKNNTVANAQMLLVLKWLDNEIIKNRDFNLKHNTNRKIIVAIDEAHVFIDNKYPIALDFMFQLAKRIRKYNGMQIIITQNIKDFVGSEEIARKSTAIINACQYSYIFALAPNDMHDLCILYEKAGQINSVEQDEIVNNPRGSAFLITSPMNRCNVNIIASPAVQSMFEKVKERTEDEINQFDPEFTDYADDEDEQEAETESASTS